MPLSIFMGIEYEDAYQACVVSEPNDTEHRFASGDPVEDWRAACRKAYELAQSLRVPCMTLSSVTHFTQDVPGYCWTEDDMLIRDERDYKPDGTVKTKAEVDAEYEASQCQA